MKVKRFLMVLIQTAIIVSGVCSSTAFAQNKEVIINSIIIELVKANFGEAVIINKIRISKTKFDLSTANLIKLKNAGVSENIINAMMEAQNPHQSSTERQLREELVHSARGVFILRNGKLVEMDYVAGYVKNQTPVFSSKRKLAIIAHGERAPMRITNKTPTFYARHPSEIGIVKFDVDTYRGKLVRYVMLISSFGSTLGDFPEKNNIEFDYKKESNIRYQITPKNPLSEGEYGIIIVGGASGYKIYDFGVDEK